MLSGREFHIRGAACLNDLSPSVFEFVLGICSNEQSSDLKWWLPSGLNDNKSVMYWGAIPFRALYTNKPILNSTRNFIGNQWRCIKTGVIWEVLGV